MHTRLAREQVSVETTWNLDDLFASESDWAAACQAVDEARLALQSHQGQLGRDAVSLLAGLRDVEALQVSLVRVTAFARLRNAQDGSNPQH